MRLLQAPLATALLCCGVGACGSTAQKTGSASRLPHARVAANSAGTDAGPGTTSTRYLNDGDSRSPGPAYLRRATSCAEVMTRLLDHFHSRFAAAPTVTSVRSKSDEAYALLGSRTTPASYVILRRERGSWKINGLLGGPLP
jgi:hypothetical protein